MSAAARRMPAANMDRTDAAMRGVAVMAFAMAALLVGPEIAACDDGHHFRRPAGHGGRASSAAPAASSRRALAVGAALVGSVLRFNAMQLMGAVGVGVAAGAGTGIVTGLVGTAIV